MISISKISTLFNTVRYLKLIQVYSRIIRLFKKYIPNRMNWDETIKINSQCLNFVDSIPLRNSNYENSFNFLNQRKDFLEQIDWNYIENGRLWSYNLNYFEYLGQEKMTPENGVRLIDEYINKIQKNVIGLEPYPLSLRCINWIRFFIRYNSNARFDLFLYKQLILLTHQIEYHLLGNHLLENGFALLFGAYYFNDEKLYNKAKKILIPQIKEQILPDGGHFELSPMYHSVVLFRMLDCYNLVSNNDFFNKELKFIFKDTIERMVPWLNIVVFKNDNMPLFNDAAFGISPTTKQLNDYALRLGLSIDKMVKLNESGYRKLINKKFELIADVGKVGPDYQPGHSHADTLNFELHINGRAVIVDSGTSTYEENEVRYYERSSAAHNTVVINNLNSSEIWASHRVAKRARVMILQDNNNYLCAFHDGYRNMKITHQRSFEMSEDNLQIIDSINTLGYAYLHFHPDEKIEVINNSVYGSDFKINFTGADCVQSFISLYSPEFNKRKNNLSVRIRFSKRLITNIL